MKGKISKGNNANIMDGNDENVEEEDINRI